MDWEREINTVTSKITSKTGPILYLIFGVARSWI